MSNVAMKMHPPAEIDPLEAMIRGCQRGERAAQAVFYRTHSRLVASIIAKILGPSGDVEDAVQDAFVEIFSSIQRFEGRSKITTWIHRLCVNVAYQKLRKKRRSPRLRAVELDVERGPVDRRTPMVHLEAKERIHAVYAILDTLPRKRRTVFILAEIVGLSHKEIATIVGAVVPTVRTRLHYARKEFYRKTLGG